MLLSSHRFILYMYSSMYKIFFYTRQSNSKLSSVHLYVHTCVSTIMYVYHNIVNVHCFQEHSAQIFLVKRRIPRIKQMLCPLTYWSTQILQLKFKLVSMYSVNIRDQLKFLLRRKLLRRTALTWLPVSRHPSPIKLQHILLEKVAVFVSLIISY